MTENKCLGGLDRILNNRCSRVDLISDHAIISDSAIFKKIVLVRATAQRASEGGEMGGARC
jgi:hypothetical protein